MARHGIDLSRANSWPTEKGTFQTLTSHQKSSNEIMAASYLDVKVGTYSSRSLVTIPNSMHRPSHS